MIAFRPFYDSSHDIMLSFGGSSSPLWIIPHTRVYILGLNLSREIDKDLTRLVDTFECLFTIEHEDSERFRGTY